MLALAYNGQKLAEYDTIIARFPLYLGQAKYQELSA
jgi:hypothetical protein